MSDPKQINGDLKTPMWLLPPVAKVACARVRLNTARGIGAMTGFADRPTFPRSTDTWMHGRKARRWILNLAKVTWPTSWRIVASCWMPYSRELSSKTNDCNAFQLHWI